MQDDYNDFEDQFVQILASEGVDVEVEKTAVLEGKENTPVFVSFEGIYYARSTAGVFTASAAVLPDLRLYILSLQDANDKSIPFFPYLFMSVLGRGHPANEGGDKCSEGSE